MEASKTYFEQIPIETVKRIAKEFPDKHATGSDGEKIEPQVEAGSPRERWRELADNVQQERDPQRMIDLVQQLITELDQKRFCKDQPRTPEAGNRSGGR